MTEDVGGGVCEVSDEGTWVARGATFVDSHVPNHRRAEDQHGRLRPGFQGTGRRRPRRTGKRDSTIYRSWGTSERTPCAPA